MVKGFILAAGFGTRLRPVTDHLPKALVPLAAKPLLQHAIDFLHHGNIGDIGVNTHYMADKISTYLAGCGSTIAVFDEQPDIRGTGGALDFARTFLSEADVFLVMNVDIVARFDLKRYLQRFLESPDCCRLLAFPAAGGTGTICYDPRSMRYRGAASVKETSEDAATADFIGITLYRREFLSLVGPDDFSILPVWQRAAQEGMPVSVDLIDAGYWRDIGTPASLAGAHFDILDGRLDLAVPGTLCIDRTNRICYPYGYRGNPADLGKYSWIGERTFLPKGSINRTVVFENAEFPEERKSVAATLLTPWGAVPFNE